MPLNPDQATGHAITMDQAGLADESLEGQVREEMAQEKEKEFNDIFQEDFGVTPEEYAKDRRQQESEAYQDDGSAALERVQQQIQEEGQVALRIAAKEVESGIKDGRFTPGVEKLIFTPGTWPHIRYKELTLAEAAGKRPPSSVEARVKRAISDTEVAYGNGPRAKAAANANYAKSHYDKLNMIKTGGIQRKKAEDAKAFDERG